MKRITAFILVIVMLFSVSASASSATVGLRYTHISQGYSRLTINKSTGTAQCYALCSTHNSTDSIIIFGSLERLVGGAWSSVNSWTSTGTSIAIMNKTQHVSSGYTYRFVANVKIYSSSGSFLETATFYQYCDYIAP